MYLVYLTRGMSLAISYVRLSARYHSSSTFSLKYGPVFIISPFAVYVGIEKSEGTVRDVLSETAQPVIFLMFSWMKLNIASSSSILYCIFFGRFLMS